MNVDLTEVPTGYCIHGVDLPAGSDLFVLSYDDGPEPGGTNLVLDALDEFDAQATFFVLMTRVGRELSLVKEILARGHELGLHGQDHRRLPTLSPDTATNVLRDAKARLEDIAAREIYWYRPPYGDQTASSWRAALDAGLAPVMWTVEARDWTDTSDDARVAAAGALAEPGGIVLCHDGYPDARDVVDTPRPPRPFDRGVLARRILDHYRRRGLTACTLGMAMGLGQPRMRVWLNRDDRRQDAAC